ncbi:hypothetical protein MSG28_013455 [Choristoneura fumiferana]|uniref:Uncharacterized protein n=1 Tax=Choristoneura fumiferana TaxID=7141 RepID=A0ACC0KTJ0_CHOFU|nr:hypothetical protein MSG28_013455 [Choristoneura fumiferana]
MPHFKSAPLRLGLSERPLTKRPGSTMKSVDYYKRRHSRSASHSLLELSAGARSPSYQAGATCGVTLGVPVPEIWGSERFDRWCYGLSRRATGEYCVKGKQPQPIELRPCYLKTE